MTEPEKRDLVLNPGEYAFLQDQTRGVIKTYVGPVVVNQTGQDSPVQWNTQTRRFERMSRLEGAVCPAPIASEGDYIVLENPASDAKTPQVGAVSNTPDLLAGCKVNIPGPCTFALWPSQSAQVVQGHTLRSNQFLVVRVYNEDLARKNWGKAVIKGADGAPKAAGKGDFMTIGQRLIIKGTEVSFYIPPTGIEVAQDDDGIYVREAVTLERLEFCILVDEDGNKRYEKGPQVVFPKPTEEFFVDGEQRKYKAIELNPIQGLHVKVIAPYEENGKKHEEGDELFITGKDCSIYFPRPEHSIIQYGSRMKHYGVAVPAGEARYVMNRITGDIATTHGPAVLLPNPTTHVIVRRVLSPKEVGLWYPGNDAAQQYNEMLRGLMSENGLDHLEESRFQAELAPSSGGQRASYLNYMSESSEAPDSNLKAFAAVSREMFGAIGTKGTRTSAVTPTGTTTPPPPPGGIKRGTQFTKPRELLLDTKYDGVPVICPWTGYAVLVVSKTGKRRVVVGPSTVLLGYDETLEVLSMSTGKPKNSDRLLSSVYLRTKNNKVSDHVWVDTADHVRCRLELSFLVNFEGEAEKWFEVENYVKFLTDHVRSMLKGAVRKISVEEFYGKATDIVRDLLLGTHAEGKDRPGRLFKENGMRIADVEVLGLEIEDAEIRKLLVEAQVSAVAGNIRLGQDEKTLLIARREEEIARLTAVEQAETAKTMAGLEVEKVKANGELMVAKLNSELESLKTAEVAHVQREKNRDIEAAAMRLRVQAEREATFYGDKRREEMRLEGVVAETKAAIDKINALQPGFCEALLAVSNQETLEKVAKALSAQQLLGGDNLVDVVQKVFKGSPLETVLRAVVTKAGSKAPVMEAAGDNGGRR